MAKDKNTPLVDRLTEALKEQPELLAEAVSALETVETLANELDEAKSLLDAANDTNEKLSADIAKLQSAEKKGDSKSVKGAFEAAVVIEGKEVKKKFKFRDGALKTRLKDGRDVPTELLIKVATGGKLTADELKANEALASLCDATGKDNGAAIKWLTHLAQIGYGLLVEV
jgi:hypothetical protein